MEKGPEETRKGNPLQLPKKQHIHSAAAIARFAVSGKVAVWRVGSPKVFQCKPDNDLFCAKRSWAKGIECGLFVTVEKAFQEEVNNILATNRVRHHLALTDYLVIWTIRAQWDKQRPKDIKLNGISESNLTKEEEEVLEKKGAAFLRGAVIPGRIASIAEGIRLFDILRAPIINQRWRVIHASPKSSISFICADHPNNTAFLPLTPSLAVAMANHDSTLSQREIEAVNWDTLKCARRFAFWRPVAGQ